MQQTFVNTISQQPSYATAELAVSPLKVEDRKAKDVLFGVLYLGLFMATFIIVLSNLSAANKVFKNIESCSSTSGGSSDTDVTWTSDLTGGLQFLWFPIFGAMFVGALWMYLLYKYAIQVVYATNILKGLILVTVGVVISANINQSWPLITFGGSGVVYFAILWCMRNKIELTAKLIEQSIVVVAAHPQVYAATALLLLFKILVLALIAGAYLLVFVATMKVDGPEDQCSAMTAGDQPQMLCAGAATFERSRGRAGSLPPACARARVGSCPPISKSSCPPGIPR